MPEIDRWSLEVLGGAQPGAFVYAMLVASALGSGWTLLALIPLLRPASTRRPATILLVCVLCSSLTVFCVKHLVRRPRPCAAAGTVTLVERPVDPSFPSGHAAGGFTVATFVWATTRRRRQARLPSSWSALLCFGCASSIALSRVVLGVHYATDVIGGAVIGAISGAVGAHRVLASPEITATGDAR